MRNCKEVKSFVPLHDVNVSNLILGPMSSLANDTFMVLDKDTGLAVPGYMARVLASDKGAKAEAEMCAAAGLAGLGPQVYGLFSCEAGRGKKYFIITSSMDNMITLEAYYQQKNRSVEPEYLQKVGNIIKELYDMGISRATNNANDFAISTSVVYMFRFKGSSRTNSPVDQDKRSYNIAFGSSYPHSAQVIINAFEQPSQGAQGGGNGGNGGYYVHTDPWGRTSFSEWADDIPFFRRRDPIWDLSVDGGRGSVEYYIDCIDRLYDDDFGTYDTSVRGWWEDGGRSVAVRNKRIAIRHKLQSIRRQMDRYPNHDYSHAIMKLARDLERLR